MYYFFLDNMQIPIPPPELTTSIRGKNETIDLINVGEVNVIKPAGLTEVEFTIMLPNNSYPFNQSLLMKFQKASYYLGRLEKFKQQGKPIQFIVVRMSEKGSMLAMTNMKVTLEEYEIQESHEKGIDMDVQIKLKQWRDYGTKKITVETDQNGQSTGTVSTNRPTDKVTADTAKVKQGSTLQQIVKKELGNTNNLFAIAALNKIAVPAALAVGQVISLKENKS